MNYSRSTLDRACEEAAAYYARIEDMPLAALGKLTAAAAQDDDDYSGGLAERLMHDLILDHLQGHPPTPEQWAAAGARWASELLHMYRHVVAEAFEEASSRAELAGAASAEGREWPEYFDPMQSERDCDNRERAADMRDALR